VFKGAIFPGPAQQTYDVPALKAGSYGFVCTVHPNMTGTLTVN
jgi:plastocyanin